MSKHPGGKKKKRFLQALSSRLNETFWERATTKVTDRVSAAPPTTSTAGQAVTDARQRAASSAPVPLKGAAGSPTLKHIGNCTAVAGAAGAVAGATGEAYKGYKDFRAGEMTAPVYVGRISVQAAQTGAGVGGRTAAAVGLQEGAKHVARKVGGETLKRLVGSNVATGVAFGLVEQGIDTVHLARGAIDRREYGTRSVQTAGSTGGALTGAAVGATVGSAVPVLGTAIGAVVGGVLGGIGGSIGGRRLGERLFSKKGEGQ